MLILGKTDMFERRNLDGCNPVFPAISNLLSVMSLKTLCIFDSPVACLLTSSCQIQVCCPFAVGRMDLMISVSFFFGIFASLF